MTRVGILVLLGSWLPLIAVGVMDPAANPIGLGLLAIAGSAVGLLLTGAGLVVILFRRLR
jgi:hypothetical protein